MSVNLKARLAYRMLGSALILVLGELVAGCVISPAAEYRHQYEDNVIGKSILEWTKNWDKPVKIEQMADDTTVYTFERWRAGHCVQHYRVNKKGRIEVVSGFRTRGKVDS